MARHGLPPYTALTYFTAADKGDVPTARAITERLVKIRNDARKNGTLVSHFGISSAQAKTSSGKAGTPRKFAAANSMPSRTTSLKKSQSPAGAYPTPVSPSPGAQRRVNARKIIKVESDDDSDAVVEITRSVKKNTSPLPDLDVLLSTPFKYKTSSGMDLADLSSEKPSDVDDDIAAATACKRKFSQPDFVGNSQATRYDMDAFSTVSYPNYANEHESPSKKRQRPLGNVGSGRDLDVAMGDDSDAGTFEDAKEHVT